MNPKKIIFKKIQTFYNIIITKNKNIEEIALEERLIRPSRFKKNPKVSE